MKIALITDTHFGAKNDSVYFQKYISLFYDFFFEYLDKNQIKTIIHLGDVFDRRKFINFLSLEHFYNNFLDKAFNLEIDIHMLTGNHDTFYKNTNRLNSLNLIVQNYAKIYCQPETITIDNHSIDLVPWVTQENFDWFIEMTKKSKSQILLGHLEVEGFSMYKGMKAHGGLHRSVFDRYQLVCSGHYHTKSTQGNINYLGAPYEITWSDYNDRRGFHILDLDDCKLEYIQNPNTLFAKIKYDDRNVDEIESMDFEQFKNKFVKVLIINRSKYAVYDRFIERLSQSEILDYKVEEDFSDFTTSYEENFDIEDTMDILNNYVKGLTIKEDEKDKLQDILTEVYIEAMNRE